MPRWYEEGLRFSCTRCGNCCTGAPGTVRVSDDEIEALAEAVELPNAAFREVYTRALRGALVSLQERRDGSCVFYEPSRGCSVYEARPRQCRSFPFWQGVVASRENWEAETAGCPGMGRGELHSADEIDTISAEDGTFSAERRRRQGSQR